MMSGFTIQQQAETDDLYAHEDKSEQELYYQDQEGEAKTCIESLCMHPSPSNLSCLCSSKGTAHDHHDSHPFHKPLSHTEWCSADDLAKIGPGIKRRLPFTVSATEVANASTTVPLRQPSEPKTRKQLPLEQEDLDVTLRGFTKITLPTTFSGNRFSDSAPGSSSHVPSSLSERMMPVSTNPTTPSPVKGSPLPAQQHGTVMPRPPLPPLRRTTSDPTPASVYNVEESHNSQRIKRMRNQLKEMSEWWDRVLRQQEEEHEVCHEQVNNATKDDENGAEDETMESVSVDVVGKCLSVNFCCPCGKGYQILLSGRNCYYKLI